MERLLNRVKEDAIFYNEENPKAYLEDVTTHGCMSGICSGLVYTADCHQFYDEYLPCIEEAMQEYKEDIGQHPIENNRHDIDTKNFMAWFGYEYAAFQLLDQWEDDE